MTGLLSSPPLLPGSNGSSGQMHEAGGGEHYSAQSAVNGLVWLEGNFLG